MATKKRTVDTWKKKKWYDIIADDTFDNKEIAKTVSIESKKLIGRKIKKNLKDITNNIKDSKYTVTFRINKVTAGKAETELVEIKLKNNFLKRTVRRDKSKIEPTFFVTTKDNKKLKLKILFISGTKYTTLLRRESRKIIIDEFTNEIKKKTLKEVWSDLILQKTALTCKKKLVKLGYVYKIMMSKAKLI